ncbi:MAG: CPBP family intramembrane metalloprotease [Ruminococcus sp.]|nr:CPBP family intramembrane metalloprotease [Ruminococcus sp.]
MKKFLKTLGVCFMGFVILIIAQFVGIGLGELLVKFTGIPEFTGGLVASVIYPFLTYLLLKIFCKKFLSTEISEFGIGKLKLKPVWCIIAFVLPVAVDFLLICMGGDFHAIENDLLYKLNIFVTGVCLYSIAGGIVEEMIFRGVIMGIIKKNYNTKSAVIIPSVLFGIVHLANGRLDFLSAVQLIIAGTAVGIMFSLIMLNDNNFWNNALVHAVWNMSTLGLFHIQAFSAEYQEISLFNFVMYSDDRLITGGEFGTEVSVIAILGYIVVSAVAFILNGKISRNHKITDSELS